MLLSLTQAETEIGGALMFVRLFVAEGNRMKLPGEPVKMYDPRPSGPPVAFHVLLLTIPSELPE
jgi:hypothetical protein